MEELTPGQLLASMRKIVKGSCTVCGSEFEGTTRRQFCSDNCRNRSSWDAKREKYNADRRERYRQRKAQPKPPEQAPN